MQGSNKNDLYAQRNTQHIQIRVEEIYNATLPMIVIGMREGKLKRITINTERELNKYLEERYHV